MDEFANGVLLYGAGRDNFHLTWGMLKQLEIPICAVADRDKKLQGTKILGVDVISLEALIEYDNQAREKYPLVLTVRNPLLENEIIDSLSILNNAKIYPYHKFYELAFKNYSPKNLADILCHLTDHCNLNCVRCSHASPLCNEYFLEEKSLERDLSKLTALGIENYVFELAGGEPLLHPRAYAFPYIIKKYYPNTQVVLVTNGILLGKMDDTFYKSCYDNDVEIWVTRYPIDYPYEDITKHLLEKNIRVAYGNSGNLDNKPKEMWRHPLRVEGGLDADYNFRHCELNSKLLRDGVIYHCCAAYIGEFLNSYFGLKLPERKQTGVDIHDTKTRDELLNLLSKPVAMCSHCDVKYKNTPIPWEITNYDLGEWTIN